MKRQLDATVIDTRTLRAIIECILVLLDSCQKASLIQMSQVDVALEYLAERMGATDLAIKEYRITLSEYNLHQRGVPLSR